MFFSEYLTKLNDTNYNGYKYVGNKSRSKGYVKKIIFGEEGNIIPDLVGGNSTQFFCDYHDTNIPNTETLYGMMIGGHAIGGMNDGIGYVSSNLLLSDSIISVGSRLCFIPHK